MRSDRERLLDILEAIAKIEKYSARSKSAFERDELIQNWMVHHLAILGEAASGLTDELRSSCPQVPWKKLVGMRNVLVHGYFAIDCDIVWQVIEAELPTLKLEISRLVE